MIVRHFSAGRPLPRQEKRAWVAPSKPVAALERIGGHPALDFANTVSWRGRDRAIDYLRDYPALISWSRTAGLLAPREAAALARMSRASRAPATLARALGLRESIFRIGRAIVRGTAPRSADVATVHAARVAALRSAHLVPGEDGTWVPDWTASSRDLDRPWWPVAVAFASLLESPPDYPLGMCPDCSWLFLDTSRNRSRRWCSSGDCGNRARGQRFRDRHSGA